MVDSGEVLPKDERVLLVQTSSSGSFFIINNIGGWYVHHWTILFQPTHNTKMTFLLHKRFHLELPVVVVGLLELVKRY